MDIPRQQIISTLALIVLLTAACTTNDPATTASPSPTPEATRTPFPPAVIITPDPTPTPHRDTWDTRLEVTIVDLDSFETIDLLEPYQPVYESDHAITAPDYFFPNFTSDGTGVWLAFRDESLLRRIDLDGSVAREIPDAWRLEERTDGRIYYYGLEDGRVSLSLYDETGLRLGEFHSAFGILSPDGKFLANTSSSTSTDGRTAPLTLTDLRTSQTTILDQTVGLCECGSRPRIYWSPSSRYLAYEDNGALPPPHESPQEDTGVFLVDIETSEIVRLAPRPWHFTGKWFGDDEVLIARDGGLVILHAPTGTERMPIRLEHPITHASVDATETLLAVSDDDSERRITRVYSLQDEEELGQWDGVVRTVAHTPDGPALLLAHTHDRTVGCYVTVVHPNLEEPLCFPHDGPYSLSPNGRYLAAGIGNSIRIYDLESGLEPVHFHHPRARWPWFEWNPQGTHLLIAQGFGL